MAQNASSVSALESCEKLKDGDGCCWLDSSSEYTSGCLVDKCRRRLLMPPLSTSFVIQMQQLTAFILSKRLKCLQITLRCRGRLTGRSSLASMCVIISTGPPCGASMKPFTEELISVVTLSDSSSSNATSTEEENKVTFSAEPSSM